MKNPLYWHLKLGISEKYFLEQFVSRCEYDFYGEYLQYKMWLWIIQYMKMRFFTREKAFSKGKFFLRNGALSRWLRKARYSMGLENFSWSGDRPFSHFHKTGCEQDWYGFVAFASCHNVLTEKFLYTFTNKFRVRSAPLLGSSSLLA